MPRRTGTLASGTVVRRMPDLSFLNSAAPSRRRHPFRSDTVGAAKPAPHRERHPRGTRYLPRGDLNKTQPSVAALIGASPGIIAEAAGTVCLSRI